MKINDAITHRYDHTDADGRRELAAQLNISPSRLRGAISEYRRRQQAALDEAEIDPAIPHALNLIAEPALELDFGRWAYASDLHCPLHSRVMVDRLAKVIRKRNVEALIVGGDLFDFDKLSRHPQIHRAAETSDTVRIAGDMIVYLADLVDQLVLMPGNHCLRLAKQVGGGGFDFGQLVHAGVQGRVPARKLIITNRDYCYVGPEETGWVVGHPSFFEGAAAKGLAQAAMRERRNVIGAHTHAQSLSRSPDGRYLLVYPGHMTEPGLTPYIQQGAGLSKYASWTPGFVVVGADGRPTLYDDGRLTDWSRYE